MRNEADLVPAHLAVQAMRDNGYKNTAYAIAELIDNSVQAGASSVELLCQEEETLVNKRVRRRLSSVAILDNGHGMDRQVLQMALQFGNGTHLNDRSGIGRFGMGLPSASISQCRKFEVWSWQGGTENALYTFVDLDLVRSGEMSAVPTPEPRPIPHSIVDRARNLGESGTLVSWTNLDRVMWKTAQAVIKNSEFLIARMYRRFLADDRVSIRMASFTGDSSKPVLDHAARANDPGYLIVPSSTPDPFDKQPMFRPAGDNWEVPYELEFNGAVHNVTVRYSIARPEARPKNVRNPGSSPYGKHAQKNIGVSIVRADRELDMDQSLVTGYDPVERWWGVEIEFDPELDELFGVTNNKQAARHFSDIAQQFEAQKNSNKDWVSYKAELTEDGDPTIPLIELVQDIDRALKSMRDSLDIERKGTEQRKRHKGSDPASAEAKATRATRERQDEGHKGQSDDGEKLPSEEREEGLSRELEASGIARQDAKEIAARTIRSGVKYAFADAEIEGMSFFTVKSVVGELLIKLNINHPAYKNLVEVLEKDADPGEASADQLRERLQRASTGLRLLLSAWARLEDEQQTDRLRAELQQIRSHWGAVAHRFMDEE